MLVERKVSKKKRESKEKMAMLVGRNRSIGRRLLLCLLRLFFSSMRPRGVSSPHTKRSDARSPVIDDSQHYNRAPLRTVRVNFMKKIYEEWEKDLVWYEGERLYTAPLAKMLSLTEWLSSSDGHTR
jgi:hypothetical protein